MSLDSPSSEPDNDAAEQPSPSQQPASPAVAPAEQPDAAVQASAETSDVQGETANELASLQASNEVEVNQTFDLSTVSQVLADSIIAEPTTANNFISLKEGIDINADSTKFTVNTVSDDLKLRNQTGDEITTIPKGSTVDTAKGFKIFKPTGTDIKLLMIKVNYNGQEGYLAAPYLKLYNPSEQTDTASTTTDTPTPAPAAATPTATPEVQPATALNRLRATNMQRVSGVGDSIAVGMFSTGNFARMNGEVGQRTSGHLRQVQRLISTRQINSANTDSFILYGAGNNFSATEYSPTAVTQAVSDFSQMVDSLNAVGIQPVLCTMFESISDNPTANSQLSQDQINSHPRIVAVREFNRQIRELASQKSVPLIDMHTLSGQNPRYAVHPGMSFYRQMVNLIQSSLSQESQA